MATASEKIEVRAGLKDEFTRPLRGMSRSLGTFTKGALGGFGRLVKAATSFRGILLALGSAYVVRSLTRLITETAKLGDQFQKLSIRTGASVEFLSEMKFAAEQSGVEFSSLEKGIIRLQKTMGDFTVYGLKEAQDSFAALGPDVLSAVENGESLESVFMKVAEALSQVTNEADKAAISQKLFGRDGGAKFLSLIADGERGIRQLREEARELNIQWTQLQADTSAEFNDAVNRLTRSFEGLKKELAVALMPALTDFFNEITTWLRENRHDIIGFFRDDLPDAFEEAEIAINRMSRGFLILHRHYLQLSRAGAFVIGPAGQKLLGFDPKEWTRVYNQSLQATAGLELRMSEILAGKTAREAIRSAEDRAADLRKAIERSERAGAPPGAIVTPEGAFIMGRTTTGGTPTGLPPPPPAWAQEHYRQQAELERRNKIIKDTMDRLIEAYDPMIQMQQLVWSTADALSSGLGNALVDLIGNIKEADDIIKEFAKTLLDNLARTATQAMFRILIGAAFSGAAGGVGGAAGGSQSGTYSGTAAGRNISSGTQFRYPGMQHGGVIPPGINRLVMAHGGAEGEAFIRLGTGGKIPVEFTGGGSRGGDITIINIAGDNEERIVQVLGSRAEMIRNIVAKGYQQRPTYRRQYG